MNRAKSRRQTKMFLKLKRTLTDLDEVFTIPPLELYSCKVIINIPK